MRQSVKVPSNSSNSVMEGENDVTVKAHTATWKTCQNQPIRYTALCSYVFLSYSAPGGLFTDWQNKDKHNMEWYFARLIIWMRPAKQLLLLLLNCF